jgi:protein-S-isoprenylcysteine O-methyltransferase Ste14
MLGNLISAMAIVAFVAYITRYQIIPEERLLQKKFSADFTAYKARVRRWI